MQLKTFYTIRFSDCDPMGHLNNARYIDYMLNAREDHLKQYYNMTLPELLKQGLVWVVRKHEIQYLKPALYNEVVCIESKLIETSESNLVVEIVMYDEQQQHLKAILWCTFTCVDIKTGRRKEHTPDFMQFAKSVQAADVNLHGGITERIKMLKNAV
jgi:Predicted thioesterase